MKETDVIIQIDWQIDYWCKRLKRDAENRREFYAAVADACDKKFDSGSGWGLVGYNTYAVGYDPMALIGRIETLQNLKAEIIRKLESE